MRGLTRGRGLVAAAALGLGAWALSTAGAWSAAARAAVPPPVFGRVTVLPGSGGAEPSMAIDHSATASRDTVYVTAIAPGANLWHSSDSGAHWSQPAAFDVDGVERGGDDDVAVAPDGTVYVVDLNVTHSWVQSSTDHGQTFSTGTATTPEADRPWITADGPSNVYVVYHDFAAETLLFCKSTDRGVAFLPCVDMFGSNDSAALTQCLGNTDIGKSLRVDPVDGSLNLVFSCSTLGEAEKTPPYGPVHDYYLSKSTDGGLTWSTHTMFTADTGGGRSPTLSNFWTSLAIDSAGTYYALMDGTLDDTDVAANPYHVYLLTSHDHGLTWSPPVVVDDDLAAVGRGTHVLSDIYATQPGQVDVVYYETDATGEPNGVCGTTVAQGPCPGGEGLPNYDSKSPRPPGWRVWLAQSLDAAAAQPAFTRVPLTAAPTHYGRICTNGIVCGASDRSLLDYISVAVDCRGMAHVAFAGNPKEASGQSPQVYVADQTGGAALGAPAACGVTAANAGATPAPASPSPSPAGSTAGVGATATPNTSGGLANSAGAGAGCGVLILAGAGARGGRRRRRRSGR